MRRAERETVLIQWSLIYYVEIGPWSVRRFPAESGGDCPIPNLPSARLPPAIPTRCPCGGSGSRSFSLSVLFLRRSLRRRRRPAGSRASGSYRTRRCSVRSQRSSSTPSGRACASWHVAVGMHRQGYDLQLTQYDDRGWRATFYTTGMEHSPTGAIGTAWERTPWRAVQSAAWEALKRSDRSG